MKIALTVNGGRHEQQVEPRLLLVQYLRDVLGLTGTHVGCETGLCGACTVMLDGAAVKSCMVLAVQANGSSVQTIEGLARDGKLDPVQEGFWERHGLQCGYCTPGMIMAARALLDRNRSPTDEEIRQGLEGNLCRCTGYHNIVEAVRYAAEKGASASGQGRPSMSTTSVSLTSTTCPFCDRRTRTRKSRPSTSRRPARPMA